jgi:hypothetical protein
MPVSGPRYRFNSWQITGAAAAGGVYALWKGDELVYIGRAHDSSPMAQPDADLTIRGRLLGHYTRRIAPHDATHFSYELSAQPAAREAELLLEFQQAHARLPRGNA